MRASPARSVHDPVCPPSPPRAARPTAIRGASLALAALTLLPPLAHAQACDTPDHRAFDFWVGSWEVRAADGSVAGYNTIQRKMDGCVLHERYTTSRGYEGESLNIYDATRDVWHQTWTDNAGLLLRLEGGMEGDTMVMEGETVDADGTLSVQRISWSVVDGDPDRVRQLWEASTDGGESWTTAFDGLYLRLEDGGEDSGGPQR